MDFFAYVHGVTIKQMKDSWKAVEYYIERMSTDDKQRKFKEIRTKYFKAGGDGTIFTRETRRINLHTRGERL